MTDKITREIAHLHRELAKKGQEEFEESQKKGEKWSSDGPQLGKYEEKFKEFLNRFSFEGWLRMRKQRGLSTHVLDLLGSGYFLEHPEVADSVTGFRLTNRDGYFEDILDEKRQLDVIARHKNHPNRKIIEGSIFSKVAFIALSERAKELEGKFDLITCKPLGAWDKIYPDRYSSLRSIPYDIFVQNDADKFGKIFAVYLNRVWQLLADEGELFMELPSNYTRDQLEEFFSHINKGVQFKVDYFKQVLHMKKTQGSPKMAIGTM